MFGYRLRKTHPFRNTFLVILVICLLGGGFYVHHKMTEPAGQPRTEKVAKGANGQYGTQHQPVRKQAYDKGQATKAQAESYKDQAVKKGKAKRDQAMKYLHSKAFKKKAAGAVGTLFALGFVFLLAESVGE